MLAGFSAGTYPPASGALLADVVPEPLRLRAYSALRVAMNAGFACGASTAGFLAKYSFFWLFAGDALTTAVYGVIALLALPHGIRAAKENAPWKEALAHIGGNRPFHAAFLSALLTAMVFSQFGSTYSAFVVSLRLSLDIGSLHLADETLYGVLLGWNGVLVMICELPLTSLTQRFRPRWVMAIGYILIGAGFSLNGGAHSVLWLFAAMTIFTAGEMISMPVSSAYIAQIAPEQMRGRYMGALGMTWSLSSVLGPQLGFRLFALQPQMLWLTCGLLGASSAVVLLLMGRERREPVSENIGVPSKAKPQPVLAGFD
jgi:MFS family permease